jgi:amidase
MWIPLDSKTLSPGRVVYRDYTQFLKPDELKGKRIGFWKTPIRSRGEVANVMEEAIAFFKSQGATIIELDRLVDPQASEHSVNVMLYEFKDGINNYLKNLDPKAQVKNLQDLIEKTFSDSVEMKYHDHGLFKIAQSKGDLDSDDYRKSLGMMSRLSKEEGIDKVMQEGKLDAIIAPAGGPAWKTDLINGDNFSVGSSSPAAIAGYPSIVVPMGDIEGLPVGLAIFGLPWSEPVLLSIAYSYEQGTKKRITPKFMNRQQ